MSAPRSQQPLERLDNRLLASRARKEILEAIFDGRFTKKLPNEDRLAEMLNISRTTVRTALQSLERDGVVTRQRAIGTLINPHVTPSSLALQRLAGFDGLLAERGYEVEVESSWRWGEPPAELPPAVPAEPGDECLLIEKSYFADGTLAMAIFDVVPRQVIAVETLPEELDASIFAFSDRMWVSPIHHAVVGLEPLVKEGGNSRLDIADGQPFLRLHEMHYSAAGEPISYALVDIDKRYISLEVVRTK